MAWRLLTTAIAARATTTLTHSSAVFNAHFSTSFLITKTPKKFRKKKKKKSSPRTKLVQPQSHLIPHFESILHRDAAFHFLTKTKSHLSRHQPHHLLPLHAAAKLHRELGFPRGRNLLRSIHRHPLLFQFHRLPDGKTCFGFSDLMKTLLQEEKQIIDSMEENRVTTVRKLLMMSAKKKIPLSKIIHTRSLFGVSEDFGDRVEKYPNYFRVVVEENGERMVELVNWDQSLAVSALEREFMVDEYKVKRAFKFPLKHGKELDLGEDEAKKLDMLNTLPLVSPYSDGFKFDLWTLEAEKYRVGLLHEFLSLTLEKRASIHQIVEFKEEFCLTKHTYQMLLKQPRTFYLAGTEMNWVVFLKDGYGEDGVLIDKDPQVVFNEKLYRYAEMQEMEPVADL